VGEFVKKAIVTYSARRALTKDDWYVWARYIVGNARTPVGLWMLSIKSDRRDWELMRSAQTHRAYGEIGWLPTMAPASSDPYPYAGGVRLGRREEWVSCLYLDNLP
jgi:hypothetical protein